MFPFFRERIPFGGEAGICRFRRVRRRRGRQRERHAGSLPALSGC